MKESLNQVLNPYFYASNPQLLAYENAWINFVKNDIVPLESIISADIRDSWERCKNNHINPISRECMKLLDDKALRKRMADSRYVLAVASKYMNTIYNMVKRTGVVVDFYDGAGYLLFQLCSPELEELVEQTNTRPGCNLSEEIAGTNAVALAIKNKKPFQTSGAQNYVQAFQPWTYSSAPILNETGEILGIISVAANYEAVHEHTLGMVSAAVSAVENELYIQNINKKLEANDHQRQTLFSMVTDGVVYSLNGVIQQINQEMCTLIGRDEKEVIGQRMEDVIKTTPRISKILKSEGRDYENRELVLEGVATVYKCLFSVRKVEDSEAGGELLLLTRVDEIRDLAERITNIAEATFDDIVSLSPAMRQIVETAKKAAMFGSRVLIQGESGTGKEILAQAIHNDSARRYNPFVAIDCGAIPRELFESEMFGYVAGAFTGAKSEGKIGLLELADKGTVFLDEVGNMPIEMQAKLLRVLQEGAITKIGSVEKVEVDIRVIAATNTELEKAVAEGAFREDLYYRLNVINIEIPPLRDRKEDIPALLNYFLKKNAKKSGRKRHLSIEPDAMKLLVNYDWPGNIRQLQNYAERLLIMSNGGVITKKALPYEIQRNESVSGEMNNFHGEEPLEDMTMKYIHYVVDKHDGNITKAAEILKISRATIYNKLKKKS